jgi:hypothetical protein
MKTKRTIQRTNEIVRKNKIAKPFTNLTKRERKPNLMKSELKGEY